MRLVIPALVALLALSACADSPWRNPGNQPQPYITPTANIQPGQAVEVQPGDTVYSVARRYSVSMSDLIAINNLHPPFELKTGGKLTLPAKELITAATRAPAVEAPVRSATPAPAPSHGAVVYHQVATKQQMADSGEKQPVAYSQSNQKALSALAADTATSPSPAMAEAPRGKPENIAGAPQEKPVVPARKPELKAPLFLKETARLSNRFIWPVHGPIASTFGPKSGGTRNDGVNISAPIGTPVTAADGGTVAYAGSDIPGYGNVVLIRHPDGYMTTYAHLERIMVDKDAVAAKGDVIGTVGTTGGLTSPQLHFEIRKGAQALDPSKLLPKAP